MDFPKYNDLFNIGAGQILSANGAVSLEAVYRDGSDINIDVAAASAIGDECIGQLTNVAAGNFLDSCVGVQLDRYLYDRFGLLRNPAAPGQTTALFQVQLNGTNVASPKSFAIPAGTIVQTGTGTQLVTTTSEVYPFGYAGPIGVAVQTLLAGADQQVGKGTINAIISQIPNGPAAPYTLAVSNTLASAGAADEEQDPAFRARGRSFFTTARRGTLAAIQQAALAVPGVQTAAAIELTGTGGQPDRFVQLVVADAYTDSLAQLDAIPPTYQQQSQLLASTVFAGLGDARAAGMAVQVVVGQVIMLPIQLALSFTASAVNLPGGIDGVALRARAAVVLYTNTLAGGALWDRNAAQATLANIPGLQITGNEILSPAGGVTPTPLQVIRTSMALCLAVALGTGTVLNATQNPDMAQAA